MHTGDAQGHIILRPKSGTVMVTKDVSQQISFSSQPNKVQIKVLKVY